MKVGDQCTVSHHYGHTDTEKVMTITKIEKHSSCKTGIAVWADGLKGFVDSGLVNMIKVKKAKGPLQISIYVPGTDIKQMRKICERFDLDCKKLPDDLYIVNGFEPLNFYWLGANLAEKLQYPAGRQLHEIIEKK